MEQSPDPPDPHAGSPTTSQPHQDQSRDYVELGSFAITSLVILQAGFGDGHVPSPLGLQALQVGAIEVPVVAVDAAHAQGAQVSHQQGVLEVQIALPV